MSDGALILDELMERGVYLEVHEGRLRMDAPQDKARWAAGVVKKHRQALVARLEVLQAALRGEDVEATYELEERAGILMDAGEATTAGEADGLARDMAARRRIRDEQPEAREALLLVEAAFPEATLTIKESRAWS